LTSSLSLKRSLTHGTGCAQLGEARDRGQQLFAAPSDGALSQMSMLMLLR
jgi:hypothetical protein